MDKYIVGNWKMNQSLDEISDFFEKLSDNPPKTGVHTWIAPQTLHISSCLSKAGDFFEIGAQNCSNELKGAFTGEASAKAIKELGASFTLTGHSERRTLFGETNEIVAQKTKLALEQGLKVILCVGETKEQRESNKTLDIITEQLDFLKELGYHEELLIAYEPVWAIGTGLTASPEQAQEVHAFIRSFLGDHWSDNDSQQTPILYGGSVKPENVKSLMAQNDINGALVGGASLSALKYQQLYQD